MENYEIIERIGGGTFADVYKAKEKDTGELVAIKTLKRRCFSSFQLNLLMES